MTRRVANRYYPIADKPLGSFGRDEPKMVLNWLCPCEIDTEVRRAVHECL